MRPRKKFVKRLPNGRIDPLQYRRQREFKPRVRRSYPAFDPALKSLVIETFMPWMGGGILEIFSSYSKFFEIFFGGKYRDVAVYEVIESFRLSVGAELILGEFKTWHPDDNPRQVEKDQVLLASYDTREPDTVKIQILNSLWLDEDDGRVFNIGGREFYGIRKKLKPRSGGYRDEE